ncbi:GNAT family N-acetyltransferase [Shewanella amazonensis]|uniref:Acetyltransferase, GNAT family n=1 Tax=Shewanella amazonensis (strain ATCC BAA-1098 / SB2B) TaxID=326297 RepID=A1S514_SHEAM|nr:GNAT family protein [Shewanella amazonensis]ABL99470.1 acetyltransferase, GNAT family [Shewanella amazonensis SB2B]
MHIELFTDRLKLSTLVPNDKANFVAMQTDVGVNRYVRVCESLPQVEAKFEARLVPWEFESGEWLTLVIETLEGDFVGYTGFHQDCALSRRAEVGYMLSPAMSGRGFATEATRAVIDWGAHLFDIHKFVAWCSEQNLGSRAVLERLGFQLEGVLKSHSLIGDEWHNDCVYGLLADERGDVN